MQGNPVVAYLTQKVDLPSNHQTSLPSPTFNNLKYSLNTNDGDGRFLTLNLLEILSINQTISFQFQALLLITTTAKKVTLMLFQSHQNTKKGMENF